MSSPFDGAGKPFRETSWMAAIVLFVAAVVAVIAMWMAPGLVPEPSGSQAIESTVQNVEEADR